MTKAQEPTWTIYRHKQKPEVRYYVQTLDGNPDLFYRDGEYQVRVRTVRNVAFDKEDFTPQQAPSAGYWPAFRFMVSDRQLYEPERVGASD